MSSARQPPSPSRSRNRSQLEAAPLVGPQLAGERRRFDAPRRASASGSPPSSSPDHAADDGVAVATASRSASSPSRARRRPPPPRRRAAAAPARLGAIAARRRSSSSMRRRYASCRARTLRSAAGSMRTQRWPTWSSDDPVCSARASSAAEIADRAVVVDGGERPLHDGLAVESGGAVARRRRRRPAADGDPGTHEVLGSDQLDAERAPARPAPGRGTRRPLSTSSSSAAGCAASARGASTSTRRCDRLGELADRRLEDGEVLRHRLATSTASGLPAQTSAALHQRPRSASSTSSRSTRHGSWRSSGTTRRRRRIETGSPRARWPRRRRILDERRGHRRGPARVAWTRESWPVRPRNTARPTAVAAERSRGTVGSHAARVQPGPSGVVDEAARTSCRRPLGAGRRSASATSGQADRRHRLGERVEGVVDGRAGDRRPADFGDDARTSSSRDS